MKLALAKGSTSQTVLLFIQNSSVTTGAGLTGLPRYPQPASCRQAALCVADGVSPTDTSPVRIPETLRRFAAVSMAIAYGVVPSPSV